MKTSAFVALILLADFWEVAPSQAQIPHRAHPLGTQGARPLTAAQLTGTYKEGDYGTLDVQALPGDRVRFHYEGLAHLHSMGGPHVGEADGTLRLQKNVAVYTYPEGGGRLILRFAPRRVFITQVGDSLTLGFGQGVHAGGLYKKTSRRPPEFDPKNH